MRCWWREWDGQNDKEMLFDRQEWQVALWKIHSFIRSFCIQSNRFVTYTGEVSHTCPAISVINMSIDSNNSRVFCFSVKSDILFTLKHKSRNQTKKKKRTIHTLLHLHDSAPVCTCFLELSLANELNSPSQLYTPSRKICGALWSSIFV